MGNHPGTYSAGVTLGQAGLLTTDTDKAAEFGTGYMASDAFTLGSTLSVGFICQPVAADFTNSGMIVSKTGSTSKDYPAPFEVQCTTANTIVFFIGDGNAGGDGDLTGWQSATLTAGTTYYVIWTLTGSGPPLLYVNGAAQSVSLYYRANLAGDVAVDGGQPIYIGARSDGTAGMAGPIDEVAIYNRVLAGSVALAQYTAGI